MPYQLCYGIPVTVIQFPNRCPNYDGPELVGRQVLCVVNFSPRQIGKHLSEVLTLGVPDDQGNVVLVGPDRGVPLGGKLY